MAQDELLFGTPCTPAACNDAATSSGLLPSPSRSALTCFLICRRSLMVAPRRCRHATRVNPASAKDIVVVVVSATQAEDIGSSSQRLQRGAHSAAPATRPSRRCLLYTSDAADEE